MAEEIRGYGDASLPALLSKHIGETVTILQKVEDNPVQALQE